MINPIAEARVAELPGCLQRAGADEWAASVRNFPLLPANRNDRSGPGCYRVSQPDSVKDRYREADPEGEEHTPFRRQRLQSLLQPLFQTPQLRTPEIAVSVNA